jgi:TatD DNase family protein
MIDTHAPVLPKWSKSLQNLETVVLAGTDINDSKSNLELAQSNNLFKAAIGIHPENITRLASVWLDLLEEMLRSDRKNIVAIGECGLDINCTDLEVQKRVFELQIGLAQKWEIPLIIHSRKYNDECIDIIAKHSNSRGVFHCYTGGKKRILKILSLGEWYFGIDGNITYEQGLAEVVAAIPKNALVAETDSPFLSPLPFRGEENKPENVAYVYQKIADIWGISFEEAEKILDDNAKRLFKI